MNLVPLWASPSLVDFLPHLDLIAVDSFLANLELLTLMLTGPRLDLVNMLHLGLIWTRLLWSLPGHHGDLVPLHGLQVGLTWTW